MSRGVMILDRCAWRKLRPGTRAPVADQPRFGVLWTQRLAPEQGRGSLVSLSEVPFEASSSVEAIRFKEWLPATESLGTFGPTPRWGLFLALIGW